VTAPSRFLALTLVLSSIVVGLTARTTFVDRSAFGPDDLAHYEARGYGADLPDEIGDQPFWLAWTRGDGQAYVTLAADPWAQEETRSLGVALYRYGRVGYSWLALALVAGQFQLIPHGLLAASLLGLGGLGWVVAHRVQTWGPRSLILLAVPGALIATATDTAEALGLGLTALATTRVGASAVASAFVLGIVRPDFATGLFLRGRSALPLVGWCAAGAVGVRLLGLGLGLPYSGLNDNLTVPLAGYVSVLAEQGNLDRTVTVGLGIVSLITIVRGLSLESGWSRAAPLTTGLFVLMLSPAVLAGTQNSLRAAAVLWLVWAVPPGVDVANAGSGQTERRPPAPVL